MSSWILVPMLATCCRHRVCLIAARCCPHTLFFQVKQPTSLGPMFETRRPFAKGRDKPKDKKRDKPKITLSDQELGTVVDVEDFRSSLSIIIDGLKETYIKQLNIRAGVGLEDLEVTFDGDKYPLKELATISKKGNNLVVLNLASLPEALKSVLEAIASSGMNVNPQQEGTVIYMQLPRITREHREVLAKNAKTLFQKAKEELTKVQNRHVKEINVKMEVGGISQDTLFNAKENIHFLTQKAIADCDSLCHQKTKELLGGDDK